MSKARILGCVVGLLVLSVSVSLGGESVGETEGRFGDQVLVLERSVLGSGGSPGAADAWIMNGTLGQIASSGNRTGGLHPLLTGFWAFQPGAASALTGMPQQPTKDYLFQNFPNPFSSSTWIEYTLRRECAAELSVFDVKGRRVRTLLAVPQGPGRHTAVWDGCDEGGRRVSPGIYFYRLDVDNQGTVRKMVLAR